MYNSVVIIVKGTKFLLNYNINVGMSPCIDVIGDVLKHPESDYELELVNDKLTLECDSMLSIYREYTL